MRPWQDKGRKPRVAPLLADSACPALVPPTPGQTATPPAMMPGQIPDPSVTAGSLPGLGPLTGLPSSALTAEELKYADIRNIGAMIAPLHFLEVKLGKRPQPVKSEVSEPCSPRQNPGVGCLGWSPRPSPTPRCDLSMLFNVGV